MRLPTVQGVIERRILANYRVDPDVVQRVLPAPFRPQLVDGFAVAGICLIRLKHIRPSFVRLPLGIGSENVAHRIAVEWNDGGQRQHGVFIFRRDTNSRLNVLLGGRLFPGEHHLARFDVRETSGSVSVAAISDDSKMQVSVRGHMVAQPLIACLP